MPSALLPERNNVGSFQGQQPFAETRAMGSSAAGFPEEAIASPEALKSHAGIVQLTDVNTFGDVQSARVVLRLSGPAPYRMSTASPPLDQAASACMGFYLDVEHTRLRRSQLKKDVHVGGVLAGLHVMRQGDGVRVTFDLSSAASRRVFYLPEPFRIVVDVTSWQPQQRITTQERLIPSPTGSARRNVHRVVLDPGHGGYDPGAIGPGGLREKNVTLDIARRAAPVLASELGVSTLLTRDRDTHVSLEERAARANAFGADLFLSIHCNASDTPSAHGVQTFVLDTSSDLVAARVAARENAASMRAGAVVPRLMADLKLADVGARSTHFAELLQRASLASLTEQYGNIPDQGVKAAGFFVLVGAQMPSAMFEVSFVSNPLEEQRLTQADYRQRLADALVNAVHAYRDGL